MFYEVPATLRARGPKNNQTFKIGIYSERPWPGLKTIKNDQKQSQSGLIWTLNEQIYPLAALRAAAGVDFVKNGPYKTTLGLFLISFDCFKAWPGPFWVNPYLYCLMALSGAGTS